MAVLADPYVNDATFTLSMVSLEARHLLRDAVLCCAEGFAIPSG